MDFIVADYETDEEASALLSRGTKEFSVLIEPDTLEQMAADAAKEKRLEELQGNREGAWSSPEKSKKAFVQASTVEELYEKIKEIDWDTVEQKTVEFSGNRIDFSV